MIGMIVVSNIVTASGRSEVKNGNVIILITDHRNAIESFSSLVIHVTGARLHQSGYAPDEGWIVIKTLEQEVDLKYYLDGATYKLGDGSVPAGRYDAADLMIVSANGVTLTNDRVDIPLKISPSRIMLKVQQNQSTELIFDLVIHDLRDHPNETWGILLQKVKVVAISKPQEN